MWLMLSPQIFNVASVLLPSLSKYILGNPSPLASMLMLPFYILKYFTEVISQTLDKSCCFPSANCPGQPTVN